MNDLTELVHQYMKERVKSIVNEEISKAQIRVGERVNEIIPEITTEMLERVDFAVHQKQIIFTIKPKEK